MRDDYFGAWHHVKVCFFRLKDIDIKMKKTAALIMTNDGTYSLEKYSDCKEADQLVCLFNLKNIVFSRDSNVTLGVTKL
ncbi:MAG TPA: hypothetical protein GX497_04255 [Bacillus bacterium]|nr:hypothetical protein [Bacillus sp. (in: firmicutes)]